MEAKEMEFRKFVIRRRVGALMTSRAIKRIARPHTKVHSANVS